MERASRLRSTGHCTLLLAAAAVLQWVRLHRRSPAVRAWRPGAGDRSRGGPLSVRVHGQGTRTFVLLHGITASGDIFGADWDTLGGHGAVLVPDLLGFACSMEQPREEFGVEAHVEALEEMLAALSPGDAPVTLVGHSMGALVALHWAAAQRRVDSVTLFCAPLYMSPDEADSRINGLGALERLLALQTPLSEAACHWMCRHRWLAQWLVVALQPRWPVPIARTGVRHTWASYLGAMNGVIRCGAWLEPLARLPGTGVPVVLVDGGRDAVPVPGRADELARKMGVEAILVTDADHELPITHSSQAVDLVVQRTPA